jgi:cytidylate kinase
LNTWQDVMERNRKRLESDRIRYKQYYNIEVYEPKNYDFYLDTSNLSPEQVFQAVFSYISVNLDKRKN